MPSSAICSASEAASCAWARQACKVNSGVPGVPSPSAQLEGSGWFAVGCESTKDDPHSWRVESRGEARKPIRLARGLTPVTNTRCCRPAARHYEARRIAAGFPSEVLTAVTTQDAESCFRFPTAFTIWGPPIAPPHCHALTRGLPHPSPVRDDRIRCYCGLAFRRSAAARR